MNVEVVEVDKRRVLLRVGIRVVQEDFKSSVTGKAEASGSDEFPQAGIA